MYTIERFEHWVGQCVGDYIVEPDFTQTGSNNVTSNYSILPLAYNKDEHACSINDYAEYMREFFFRHPIMYLLFYRWWLICSLPKKGWYIRCVTKRFPSTVEEAHRLVTHPVEGSPPICVQQVILQT